MNCLITGGAGFIGSSLAKFILDKQLGKVTIVDSLNEISYPSHIKRSRLQPIMRRNVNVINADCNDSGAMLNLIRRSRFDTVFHCAGVSDAAFDRKISNVDYLNLNLHPAVQIASCCIKEEISRFLYVSCSDVYGRGINPMMEDRTIRNPQTFCAVSKKMAEDVIMFLGQSAGLNYTIVRLFHVYGPFMRPDQWLHILCEAVITSKPIALPPLETLAADFIEINDACDAIYSLAACKAAEKQIVNVGTGIINKLDSVLRLIELHSNRNARLSTREFSVSKLPAHVASTQKLESLIGDRKFTALGDGVLNYLQILSDIRNRT